MCLDIVDTETKGDVKYAYKVFIDAEYMRYYPAFYKGAIWRFLGDISLELGWYLYKRFVRPYEIEKWYTSTKRVIQADSGTLYPSGFHCYTSKHDAIFGNPFTAHLPTLKIAIDDIVASGKQNGRSVIVARKMKLIEECHPSS